MSPDFDPAIEDTKQFCQQTNRFTLGGGAF
jgi:hypothetical protein